jgi:hypothetical protein
MINGTLAGGEQVDLPKFVGYAVKSAEMLFDSLSENGYL